MPWFIYHYPFPINQPSSYTLVPDNGVPECNDGEFLGAIKVAIVPNTIPTQPDLNFPDLQELIRKAIRTRKPSEIVKLRPGP